MTKDEMEAIWNRPGVINYAHRTIWDESEAGQPGEKLTTRGCPRAAAWVKRQTKHYWPPWPENDGRINGLYMSKEARKRIRRDFPKNGAAMIAAYGKTRTKYDQPFPTEDDLMKKGKRA